MVNNLEEAVTTADTTQESKPVSATPSTSQEKATSTANGQIDNAAIPESTRNLVDDFLERAEGVAESLAGLESDAEKYSNRDNLNDRSYERGAEKITRSMKKLEVMIENGAERELVARQAQELTQYLQIAERELQTVARNKENPIGIKQEEPLTSKDSATFTFSVKRGGEFSYNYKRVTECGEIAYMKNDHEVSSDVIRIKDPSVGMMERTIDPNDPSRDLITVHTNKGFKGYLTINNGEHHTHLNVQNGHENDHLNMTAAKTSAIGDTLIDAATASAQAVRDEKMTLPKEGTELSRGSFTEIKVGSKDVGLRFQGKTARISFDQTDSVNLDGIIATREGDTLRIFVTNEAAAGKLELAVGSKKNYTSFTIPEIKPTAESATVTFDIEPYEISARNHSAKEFYLPKTSSVELLRGGKVIGTLGTDTDSLKIDGITLLRDLEGLKPGKITFDYDKLKKGMYSLQAVTPEGTKRGLMELNVKK